MSRNKDIEMLIAFQSTSITVTAALLVLASGDTARIAKMSARLSVDLAVSLALTDEIVAGRPIGSEQAQRLRNAVDRVREWVPNEILAGNVELAQLLAAERLAEVENEP
jgi:hypothetical protein